jgi:hypothetical protein
MRKYLLLIALLFLLFTIQGALANDATGGNITHSGGYTIHTFIGNGTFNSTGTSISNVQVLIIGGGGGGGSEDTAGGAGGGGGGAGGFIYNSSFAHTPGTYTVVVGASGAGGTGISNGNNGSTSSFNGLTASGGGGGGRGDVAGHPGGSGGGGGWNSDGGAGSQGNDGGDGVEGAPYTTGGGGGAGAVGGTAVSTQSGHGGAGLENSISGTAVFYAGGGGGGANTADYTGVNGAGGAGGGGAGGAKGGSAVQSGTANTGGGGGGGAGWGSGGGGNGGSGIVIIRYLTTTIPTITFNLANVVNGTMWNDTTTISNVTGNLTFTYFNITGNGFCVSYSGNGTGTNCTASGSGTSTYFNVSNTTTITGTQGVTASTYQSLFEIQASRLFLNTSIANFNGTNNQVTNQTTTGTLFLKGLSGSNNLKIDVAGNYSKNVTCTGTILTTTGCNATGIYDNLFTIGANFNNAGISNFSLYVNNASLGSYFLNTTNGSIVVPLLQGYFYFFSINSTAHSLDNTTIPANASTNLYNFSLLSYNTFDLRFYNESTGNLIQNATITVQLLSDEYATNFTTSNSTLVVTALIPESYTIRYWRESSVPREYYVTLTEQSYQNISLYLVDSDISQLYLPIVYNQYTRPVGGAVIKLLRAYINADNTVSYKIVEMTTTDTNGQGVLRVVPNIINYKLLISQGSTSFTTDPTKFTASTNAYTLSDAQSVLTSLAAIPSVTTSLTYVNATNTYVFTWADDNNLVTQGCLNVKKYNGSGISTVTNACSSASTGSIPYTLTDLSNNTKYTATGVLTTNTEFSTYTFGPLTVDTGTSSAAQIFGLVGFIIMLLLLVTIGFMANEHGSDSMVVAGVLVMVFLGVVGVIAFAWEAFIGIIIIAAILVYKLSRR